MKTFQDEFNFLYKNMPTILFEKDNDEKLYFVVESKGSLGVEFLRPSEKGKIDCGIKHFEELSRQSGQDLKMIVVKDMEDVVNNVMMD